MDNRMIDSSSGSLVDGFDDAVRLWIEGAASRDVPSAVEAPASTRPARSRGLLAASDIQVRRAVKLRYPKPAGLTAARAQVGISTGLAR